MEADYFKLAFEQSPDAVIFADAGGIIRLWNSAAEEIFGVPHDEAVGKSLDIIIPEYLREAHWKGFRKALSTSATKYEKLPLTTRALHRSSPTLFIDLTFSILKNGENRVIGALAHARDVTSRHLADQALKEGELNLGFFTANRNWALTYLNPEASRLFSRRPLLGLDLWHAFPSLKGTHFYVKLRRAALEQAPQHFEDFLPPFAKWVEVHAFPSPAGVAVYIRDINHQKRVEEELQESESRFRLLVQEAQDYAIVIYDDTGRVKSWNMGAARLYQYSESEIVGTNFARFYPPDIAASGRPETIIKTALHEGKYEEEGWRVKKDGSRFWASVSIAPICDVTGKRIGFSSVTRDMTERKKIEDERLNLLREAQEAVAARDEFLSIASHDLRSPLAALYLQLQMMHRRLEKQIQSKGIPGEVFDSFLGAIEGSERQCEKITHLMDQLLDMTRIRMGRMNLDLKEFDFSTEAEEIVQSMRGQAENRGSTLSASIEAGVRVKWDEVRIGEVLTNLISNAIKYGEENPIEVHVRSSEGHATITVLDHGMGIPKEMHGRIFDRFERVSTGKNIAGLGLGLYIVRQIVEAHGGEISVQSEPGMGATFTVKLPLQVVAKESSKAAEPLSASVPQSRPSPAGMAPHGRSVTGA